MGGKKQSEKIALFHAELKSDWWRNLYTLLFTAVASAYVRYHSIIGITYVHTSRQDHHDFFLLRRIRTPHGR